MKIKVSVINYANTIPFVYGLQQSKYLQENSEFQYHYPAQGVEFLQNNEVDLSIIPVAAIQNIPNAKIVSDYCIGANGKVDSVLLCSKVPLENITNICLDYQSKSSNMLAKILAKEVWKIQPEFLPGNESYDVSEVEQAKIVIGDRAFEDAKKYKYVYDLAEHWTQAYKLPFVFACWVANKEIPQEYLQEFNTALQYGITHIKQAIQAQKKTYSFDLEQYLNKRIAYDLGNEQQQAKELFLKKAAIL